MKHIWILGLLLIAPASVSGDLLWDNGEPDNRDAVLCMLLQPHEMEYEAVDDVDVGDPGWLVTEGHFSLVTWHEEGPDAILAVRVFFYQDDGNNKPLTDRYAERLCGFKAYDTEEQYQGEAIIGVDVAFDQVALAPGKWWVCFQPEIAYTDSYWLTSESKLESIWISWAWPDYPKWTKGYGVFGQHYDVSFTLSGEIGGSSPPDAVIDLPTEDVTIDVGEYVEFAGTATDEDGYIVDWLWSFGEGSGIDDMHVEDPGQVQFNNIGVFTVTFDAQDNDGNWDPEPDQRTITVLDIYPEAVIDLPTDDVGIAEGDFVEFAGTADDGNGYIVDWLWSFGEGSGIDDMHVEDPGSVQFNNVGVFAVTFNAQDNDGNWDPDPDLRTITVHETSPDAVIDKPRGNVAITRGESVEFAGTATDWDGWVEGFLWTFGEGSGVEDMEVEDPGPVQFNNIGVFTVTFNAQDNDGNWDPEPDTRTIYVRGEGAQVYVDKDSPGLGHDGTSWDTAFLTIQEGVDAATPGGEVWVADGTYVENIVMGEAAQLYGGFLGAEPGGYEESLDQRDFAANVATIDGNKSGSCVVMAVAARADGFVITGGDAQHGPGIHCSDLGDSGVIANNNITGNYAHSDGGGVYLIRSSPTITGNQIVGNTATTGAAVMCWTESSPTVSCNLVVGNRCTSEGTGGIHCDSPGDPTSPIVTHNMIMGNHAFAGGAILINNSNAVVANNTMACNEAMYGGAVHASALAVVLTNNTIVGNTSDYGGGLYFWPDNAPLISNNIVAANEAYAQGGGIYCSGASPELSHNDFWGNIPDDYYGCDPGANDISADPMLVDIEGGDIFNPLGGDYHLTAGSPCIDTGDNSAPAIPEYDWEGDERIVDGDGDEVAVVDMGADEYVTYYTEAPPDQPLPGGPLFGEPQSGFPGWVWFSIPLTPDCPRGSGCDDPIELLGFDCSGVLWYWDKYLKAAQVYRPPFLKWPLSAGNSYLLRLEGPVDNPGYEGVSPFTPDTFEFRLGRIGWTWVGMPGLVELTGDDFMDSVRVKYPSDEWGAYRTAAQDYEATPDNWISWGWQYWSTWAQAAKTFTPYAPFGNRTCYPWYGYRVYVNYGWGCESEDDPDQVTLIWPRARG